VALSQALRARLRSDRPSGTGGKAPSASGQQIVPKSSHTDSVTPSSLFPTENSREKTLFLGFGDEAKTKHVPAKFDLVLDELQDFPLAWT
jgi:hypothetical protein